MALNYQSIFFILASIGAVGVAVLAIVFFLFHARWKRLFGPADTEEALIASVASKCNDLGERIKYHDERLKLVEAIATKSIHKVGFVRFNPFSETGGDNSFALTLLDRDGSGVIISSLYMRDGARRYAKAIVRGASKNPLSKEEEASLKQALKA